MLIPNHPYDEILAAFAGADPDATGDRAVSGHLASCERCTATVEELRLLTSALAELPDLAPHRPLRFLPPVAAPRSGLADRVGGVIRGIFAPALTAGAALALVGAVGTFAPSFGGQGGAAVFQDAGAELQADESSDMSLAAPSSDDDNRGSSAAEAAGSPEPTVLFQGDIDSPSPTAEAPAEAQRAFAPEPDRPIWPMLLFTGVALIVVMVLLRWILAPRAG